MAATVNTVALLAAASFPSHEGHGAASGAATGFPVLASVGLYVLVLVIGTLAAPALCGMRASGRLRTAVVAALSLGYAVLVVAQLVRHQISGAVGAGVLTALVVAVVALRRGHRIEQVVAAGVLLAAQGPVIGTNAGLSHLAGVLLHVAAASLWIGSVLHVVIVLAAEGRTTAATAARRLSVLAVLSTVFLVSSGALLMVVHHVGRSVLTGSTYGHVLLAKTGALLTAVALGLTMRRRAGSASVRTWSRLVRGEAIVLAGGLALGAVLVGLAEPQPAYAATAPGLVHVRMGDESATLFVVRRDVRTGWLLYAAGDDDAPQVRITDGAGLQWTPSNGGTEIRPVTLRGGVARLTVRYENHAVHVTATPATGAPSSLPTEDDVAAALGRSLGSVLVGKVSAGGGRTCVPAVADQGLSFGRALTSLGVHQVRVVGDDARAQGFTSGLHRSHVAMTPIAKAVVLATDRDEALRLIAKLSAATGGVYLAPWLLDGGVLSATRAHGMPLVSVGSLADPMSPVADRYRAALASLAPRVSATEAGLLGFQSVISPSTALSTRIYAAAPVGFLPGVLDVGHQHDSTTSWFPNGTLVAITAPQRPETCSTTSGHRESHAVA